MKRIIKSNLPLCFTLFVIIFTIIICSNISYASNNQPFLGDCIEYGIVCNYLNQTADMETNFATGKYQSNGHSNGNTISEEKANASGKIRIGEIVGNSQFRGKPHVVIDKDVKSEVKTMLASVSNYAESVVLKKDITTSEEVKDQNNYTIDITGKSDDLVYVDADNMISNLMNGKIQNGGLKIILRADQSIVLNTARKDKIIIPRYTVIVKDGEKTSEQIAESVIWNMPYVNNLEISSDLMRATLIAPKAFVNLNVTGEGWLVCDTIVSNSGEWHMISHKMVNVIQTPEVTETPKPTKVPTSKPTSTTLYTNTPIPTPIATDEPILQPTTSLPPVTPTPIEHQTPAATATTSPVIVYIPEITSTPISTVAVEITPVPTEEAEPTATPTEEPTPEPTPTATPSEEPTPDPTATPIVPQAATSAPTATPLPDIEEGTPLVDIDEDTPLSDKELKDPKTHKVSAKSKKTTTLLDDDVPLSDSAPETGDHFEPLTIILVMLVSLISIIWVIKLNSK